MHAGLTDDTRKYDQSRWGGGVGGGGGGEEEG